MQFYSAEYPLRALRISVRRNVWVAPLGAPEPRSPDVAAAQNWLDTHSSNEAPGELQIRPATQLCSTPLGLSDAGAGDLPWLGVFIPDAERFPRTPPVLE